jgi:hypothetical protein
MREMRLDKIKGTLVDFNELEHLLDDCESVCAWQIELRKRHDDPLDLDELILHVARRDDVSETRLQQELRARFFARAEVHPNHIEFHNADEMRALHGVGTELKERKLVDHRPVPMVSATNAAGPHVFAPSSLLEGEERAAVSELENAA